MQKSFVFSFLIYAMMTMSPAPISVEQALDYYRQEYTNSKDNYYSEAGAVKGRWCGQLAEEWNLKGEVTSEQYERLVEGQDPHTGKQLIRSVTPAKSLTRTVKRSSRARIAPVGT